jgi:hypothetical protein
MSFLGQIDLVRLKVIVYKTENISEFLLNKQSEGFLFFKELICDYNNLNELRIVEKIINNYQEYKKPQYTKLY